KTKAITPDWARLEFHQCQCCHLTVKDNKNCPICLNIAEIVEATLTAVKLENPDILEVTEEPTVTPEIIDEINGAEYWNAIHNPAFGFEFAVPCFWNIEGPFDNPGGGGTYNLYNYSTEYLRTFPRGQGIFEGGGEKVNIDIIDITTRGYPADLSLAEFAAQEFNTDYSEVRNIDEIHYNGQTGISVITFYFERETLGESFYFSLGNGLVLHFDAFGFEGYDAADVQEILHSFAFTADFNLHIPNKIPAPPPVGMAAPCIPEYAEAVERPIELSEHNTTCGLDSFTTLDYLVTTVENYLQDRNTGSLRWDYFIHDPMMVGYWQSEGQTFTPDEFASALANSLYNASTPGEMTFTTDLTQFPPLFGTPPGEYINPELKIAEIVYSEGWGQEKNNAAILYFVEDECGGYYWYGLLYANGHFDK
ncbi:MAG: hypothetical protein N2D54_12465, partial [Chloroflexota bacterium]